MFGLAKAAARSNSGGRWLGIEGAWRGCGFRGGGYFRLQPGPKNDPESKFNER